MSGLLRSLVLVSGLLSGFLLHAQEDDGPPAGEKPDSFRFELTPSVARVSQSLYSHLEVLDERPDSGELGWFSRWKFTDTDAALYRL